jgi:hypothetical protein
LIHDIDIGMMDLRVYTVDWNSFAVFGSWASVLLSLCRFGRLEKNKYSRCLFVRLFVVCEEELHAPLRSAGCSVAHQTVKLLAKKFKPKS